MLGFISALLWIMLIATLMEGPGFTVAFSIISLSYLAGVILMVFVTEARGVTDIGTLVSSANPS